MAKMNDRISLRSASIDMLRKELEQRESLAQELLEQREHINQQLQELGVEDVSHRGRPRGTRTASLSEGGRGRGRRPEGQRLIDYVEDVLRKAGRPMTISEVMDAVQQAGYNTTSENFYPVVVQALTRDENIERADRGQYMIKNATSGRPGGKKNATSAA